MWMSEEEHPEHGDSQCKGPGVGMCLVSRLARRPERRPGKGEILRRSGDLRDWDDNFAFTLNWVN